MDSFVFHLPTRIVFGNGDFAKLGVEARKIGKRALLVTGRRFARESGLLDRAIELLTENGIEFVLFSEIEPNPESETIDRGGKLAREEHVEFVIAVGGGSVLDSAKAIALVATTGIPIWDFCERPPKARIPNKVLPVLTAITSAATGSEADGNAVITNTKTRDKRGIFGEALFPTTSIVDPLLTLSMSKSATCDGVVDMFVHILESYLSSKANAPVSDRISEALMKEAIRAGEVVLEDSKNIQARESLSWISTLALSGFPNAGRKGPFPMHRLGHPISGVYGIPHGRTLAIIMPSFLYHTRDLHAQRLSELGKALFSTRSPMKTIERIVHWLKKMEAFQSLKEYGIKKEDIELFVKMALADDGEKDFIKAREPIYTSKIFEIYETAHNYRELFRRV